MNQTANSHCPHCFQPSQKAVCADCGFNRAEYTEEARHLPLFSVIGGRYTLGRVLGSGGFAIVYIAKKAGEKALFAIKEYYPEQLAGRARSGYSVIQKSSAEKKQWFDICYKRFVDEARLLEACQKHPAIQGIVRYTDLIEQHDTAYLVMEYLDGCPLFDVWSQKEKLSLAQIRLWLKPLLDTLEKLHQREIYHRDISLKNIFLRGGANKLDDPVLMDFGLARQGVRDSHVQSSIIGIGTPEYMAPEQRAGNPETGIDARTDLYSLGAVLFHCINGTPPPKVEIRQLGSALTFTEKSLDPALKTAIERCLALSKKDRPDDVAALKKLLGVFLNDGETIIPDELRDAEKRAADLALWQQARLADTVEGYRAYLKDCRLCGHKEAAEEAIRRLAAEAELKESKQNEKPPSIFRKLAGPIKWLIKISVATVLLLIVIGSGLKAYDKYEAYHQKQDQLRLALEARRKTEKLAGEMVAVKGGCFQMGSPETEKGRDSDEKQHKVCVDDLEMGKHEVTKAQFKAFVTATHHPTEAETGDGCYGWTGSTGEKDKKYTWRNPGFEQTDQHLVVCVSWNDAQAYIKWLNEKTGENYGLPTEAQWEYAARAGTTTAFYTGDCINTGQANYDGNYDYDNCGAKTGVYKKQTVATGSYPANAWGLYDMAGNVWEWTCSAYVKNYDGSEEKCLINNDASTPRVLRDGSWFSTPWGLRSAFRDGGTPGYRNFGRGFRLSRM